MPVMIEMPITSSRSCSHLQQGWHHNCEHIWARSGFSNSSLQLYTRAGSTCKTSHAHADASMTALHCTLTSHTPTTRRCHGVVLYLLQHMIGQYARVDSFTNPRLAARNVSCRRNARTVAKPCNATYQIVLDNCSAHLQCHLGAQPQNLIRRGTVQNTLGTAQQWRTLAV